MGKATGIFSMALNLGQFASSLAVIPVLVMVGSYSNLFLAAGVFGMLVACAYAVAWIRERRAATQVAR